MHSKWSSSHARRTRRWLTYSTTRRRPSPAEPRLTLPGALLSPDRSAALSLFGFRCWRDKTQINHSAAPIVQASLKCQPLRGEWEGLFYWVLATQLLVLARVSYAPRCRQEVHKWFLLTQKNKTMSLLIFTWGESHQTSSRGEEWKKERKKRVLLLSA